MREEVLSIVCHGRRRDIDPEMIAEEVARKDVQHGEWVAGRGSGDRLTVGVNMAVAPETGKRVVDGWLLLRKHLRSVLGYVCRRIERRGKGSGGCG